MTLLDSGPAITNGVQVSSFTLAQTAGSSCTPVIKNAAAFPLQLGTIGVGQTGATAVVIDFTGCQAAARFTATFTFLANSGFVSGIVVRNNQFQ